VSPLPLFTFPDACQRLIKRNEDGWERSLAFGYQQVRIGDLPFWTDLYLDVMLTVVAVLFARQLLDRGPLDQRWPGAQPVMPLLDDLLSALLPILWCHDRLARREFERRPIVACLAPIRLGGLIEGLKLAAQLRRPFGFLGA
jgi:hypothetical protein